MISLMVWFAVVVVKDCCCHGFLLHGPQLSAIYHVVDREMDAWDNAFCEIFFAQDQQIHRGNVSITIDS